MSPILPEINALIQSNLEDVASNPAYENSLLALEDYSQQIEDYLDVLEELTRALGMGAKHLKHKQHHFEMLAEEAENSARQFRQERQNRLARAAQNRKQVMKLASQAFQEEADLQTERFRMLMDAKLRLEARLTEVTQKRAVMHVDIVQDEGALLPT